MDPHRFDQLTKRLATTGRTRRQLLRGLAGGLLAAALGRQAALAACTTLGRPCTADGDCCSGSCTPVAPGHGVCAACPPATCGANEYQDPRDCTCRCVFSQQVCGADEVCDLAAHGCVPAPTTEPGPCGDVGAACTTGSDCCAPNVCANGACAAACPPGSRDCDGVCHPGSCCSDADCGGEHCCGGTCTDTTNDGRNCGSCGHVCRGNANTCVEGICCQVYVGPGAYCSETAPCCAHAQCQGGICLLESGAACNGFDQLCLSGVCDQTTQTCA